MKQHLPAVLLLSFILATPIFLPGWARPWAEISAVVCTLCFYIFREVTEGRIGQTYPLTELDDPFEAEVLLGDRVVARLTDRIVTEMFWRSYRIEAVDEAGQKVIQDDALWERCAFDFRDPKTGIICVSAFVGGSAPFVKDSRVSLRAIYFSERHEDDMRKPVPPPDGTAHFTLAEIQEEAADCIQFLEETASQHPDMTWPQELLPLILEFQALASAQPLEPARIAEFSIRYKRHIIEKRIKGWDNGFWHVDALQKLADEAGKTSVTS
mgnify:CR=1 FL=1